MLILLPSIQSSLLEKWDDKKDSVVASETQGSKVHLTLLDEVVAVYVRLTLINLWGLRLESPFLGFVGISPSLSKRQKAWYLKPL